MMILLRILQPFALSAWLLTGLAMSPRHLHAQPAQQSAPLDVFRSQWNKKDGLPDWNITAYFQDTNGLMWMASNAGLFTFDGHAFRPVHSVNASPDAGKIVRLTQDLHGHIWLVKLQNNRVYVDLLDPRSEAITPLHRFLNQKKPISIPLMSQSLLFHQNKGTIWIGNKQEGYRYDGTWKKIFQATQLNDAVGSWQPAPANQVWRHLFNNSLTLRDSTFAAIDSIPFENRISKASWHDQLQNCWIAFAIAPELNKVAYYSRFSAANGRIRETRFRTLPKNIFPLIDIIPSTELNRFFSQGYMAWNELDSILLQPMDHPFTYNLNAHIPDVKNTNMFYVDRSRAIWFSTPNGLSRVVFKPRPPFQVFLRENTPTYSIRGIARANGKLYANTYGGARIIEPSSGQSSPFVYPANNVGTALLEEEGSFWIGGHWQPIQHLSTRELKNYLPPGQNNFNQVYMFLRSPSNGMLAGSDQGLYLIRDSSATAHLTGLKGVEVYCLYPDPKGLWAGTNQGLYQLDRHLRVQRKWLPPSREFPYERIEHLHQDRDGLFWMATKGAGLIRWNPQTGAARKYTEKEGLSNRNIHAVYEDAQGFLWLPSDFGLMRFHKASGQVQAFFKSDGIADNEFNAMSHYRDAEGRLYFGGINGITAFHPDDFPSFLKSNYKLTITEAKTFDLKRGSYARQLTNASRVEKLIISPSDAYLDLRLSPLLYEESDRILYGWKIKGLQKNWVKQRSPVIRLSNLPYGKNLLQVRFSLGGSGWSSKTLEVPVQVLRPFYLQWPFLTILGFLIAGLAAAFSYYRNRQLLEANLRLEKEVRHRTRQIEADKQTISQQAQELRALDEMKSRFFANVTHELRTPLTLILGPIEHLLKDRNLTKSGADFALSIQRNAQKLLTLVEELLDLSKIESNKLSLDEKPVHFFSFLSRTVAAFIPYAAYRSVELRLRYDCPTDLTLLLDAPKMEKIINNLIGNALKFTDQGSFISLGVQQVEQQIVLQVEDNGQGIAPEDIPHIFERYFQSKTPGTSLQGGTGIGLSLCREYARLFGGTLSVESTHGQGSTFTLQFPVKAAPPAENAGEIVFVENTQAKDLAPDATPEAGNRKKHTILLVEDSWDMAAYIRTVLEPEYNLLLADHGKTALTQLKTQRVDLVLSDVMMPEMDGFQLLKHVKKAQPDLPFILLTARIETPDRLQALRLGVDDYLTKPFQQEELLARLHNLLQRYEARHTTASGEEDTPPESRAAYDDKWLRQLESVIRTHLVDPNLSVERIAELMNISERSLHYKLKSFTGLTPNQYLTEARLVHAQRLLETKACQTVAEVCYAVGFKTPAYFAKLLKDRFGKTPSDYW